MSSACIVMTCDSVACRLLIAPLIGDDDQGSTNLLGRGGSPQREVNQLEVAGLHDVPVDDMSIQSIPIQEQSGPKCCTRINA